MPGFLVSAHLNGPEFLTSFFLNGQGVFPHTLPFLCAWPRNEISYGIGGNMQVGMIPMLASHSNSSFNKASVLAPKGSLGKSLLSVKHGASLT